MSCGGSDWFWRESMLPVCEEDERLVDNFVSRHSKTISSRTPLKSEHDPVSKPAHYTAGKIEPIDAIEDWGLCFHLANVVKYLARAGKKDPSKFIEDLQKARWYLDRYIGYLEKKSVR